MPTTFQFRRGTTSQNNSFTGAAGEISIDTDLDTIRVHDGSTAGGFASVSETATQTLTNKTLTSPTITGVSPQLTLSGDASGSATFTNLGNATLTVAVANDSHTHTSANISDATNLNTASTIVKRDASGDFSAGVITATTTAARYADLAERYTSDSNYAPGTVVVFGGDEEVTESTSRLSRRIAGIVSTDPAFLMNESLEDGVSVGLVGRVPCKVVGPITKGDMMVSSATPGHAEAWREEGDPPMGTVLGKALESKTTIDADVIEIVVGRI